MRDKDLVKSGGLVMVFGAFIMLTSFMISSYLIPMTLILGGFLVVLGTLVMFYFVRDEEIQNPETVIGYFKGLQNFRSVW